MGRRILIQLQNLFELSQFVRLIAGLLLSMRINARSSKIGPALVGIDLHWALIEGVQILPPHGISAHNVHTLLVSLVLFTQYFLDGRAVTLLISLYLQLHIYSLKVSSLFLIVFQGHSSHMMTELCNQ